jgi:hypothetical protein
LLLKELGVKCNFTPAKNFIMKQTILYNWNFIRWVRLVMGIVIAVQAVAVKDMMFSIVGVAIAGMAVFNIGCCSAGNCYTAVKNNTEPGKEIVYEEVVNNKQPV